MKATPLTVPTRAGRDTVNAEYTDRRVRHENPEYISVMRIPTETYFFIVCGLNGSTLLTTLLGLTILVSIPISESVFHRKDI